MIKTVRHAGNLYHVLGVVDTSTGRKYQLRRVVGGREIYVHEEDMWDAQDVCDYEIRQELAGVVC